MLIIGKKLSPYALLSISGLLAASDQAVKKTDDDLLTDEERRIKQLNEKQFVQR